MSESAAGDDVAHFVIRPEVSQLLARANSTLHPINYQAPLSGHVETTLNGAGFDTTQPTVGSLQLALDELSSRERRFDREMRDRLDAQRYPVVTAALHHAEARGGDLYRLTGELTLHGRTRKLSGDAHVTLTGSTLRATGRMTLDIRDFNVKPPKLLLLKVDPQIEVAVEIVAERRAG